MKLITESIEVQTKENQILWLQWRGEVIRAHRRINLWVSRSRWWSKDEKRIYHAIETERGLMEIYLSRKITSHYAPPIVSEPKPNETASTPQRDATPDTKGAPPPDTYPYPYPDSPVSPKLRRALPNVVRIAPQTRRQESTSWVLSRIID